MTTFALVHGAWQDGTVWQLLRPELERRGHTVVAPSLPVQDRSATYDDYVTAVLAELPGGHFPMLERPAELAALLSDLVAGGQCPPPARSSASRLLSAASWSRSP